MKWKYVVGAVAALLVAPMFLLADLTPPEVEDGITPERAKRGRALLEALAERHGRDVLAEHQRLELSLVDTWGGVMGSMFNPFAESTQTMDVALATRAWTASFRLTDGPDAGTEWGMKDLEIYRRPPGGAIESPPAEDLDPMMSAKFLVPTLRYVVVLPVEIGNAELIAALEPITEGGRTFDRVFVTWGDVAAHAEDDQYILWIDQASGRLDRVEYTVREMMRSAQGLARYEAYHETNGVLVPARVTLQAVLPGGSKARLHELDMNSPRIVH
ncbi:MAG: hypothetical protein RIT81_27315 [Deltaproteobacteria bacterium]